MATALLIAELLTIAKDHRDLASDDDRAYRLGQAEVLTEAARRLQTLMATLEAIAAIPDPSGSGDRGPIRLARHLAKCAIALRLLPGERPA